MLLSLLLLKLLPPTPMKDRKDKVWSIEGDDDDVFVADDVSEVDVLPVLLTMKLPWPKVEKPCAWAERRSDIDGLNVIRKNISNTDKNTNEEGTMNLCLFSGFSPLVI